MKIFKVKDLKKALENINDELDVVVSVDVCDKEDEVFPLVLKISGSFTENSSKFIPDILGDNPYHHI